MTNPTRADVIARLNTIFDSYASATGATAGKVTLLRTSLAAGKLYEAWVLAEVLSHLRHREGFDVRLSVGSHVALKSSPGPINPAYAHFDCRDTGSGMPARHLAVWTDVEFAGISALHRGGALTSSDYHELDIAAVGHGVAGRPAFHAVALGVECKHTTFTKAMSRAALGIRRQLSYLSDPRPTAFRSWPRSDVPAHPSSVFQVCSNDPDVVKHDPAGQAFGVDYRHLPVT